MNPNEPERAAKRTEPRPSRFAGKPLIAQEVKVPDVVHQHGGAWWFYDETWSDRVGPYPTREAAQDACNRYCREVLGY